MIVKEKFILLKNTPNVLKLSAAEIKSFTVVGGRRSLINVMDSFRNRINHFTKDKVFNMLDIIENRRFIEIVNIPNYNLHVSYNRPTRQILINLNPFGVDNIYPNEPDPRNTYACLVYGISFYNLINQKITVNQAYASTITNFFLSLFIRLFGKKYGLLGIYSTEIPKLKFLISCYILTSFFGLEGTEVYRKSSVISPINYRELIDNLNKYNFNNIDEFIKSLSEMKVLVGINRFDFMHISLRLLGMNFLPAFEDLSRFISVMTTASVTGSNIVPTFISTQYNQDEYKKILEISKLLFK